VVQFSGSTIVAKTKLVAVRAFSTTLVEFDDMTSGTDALGLPTLRELPKLPEIFFPTEQP
jgi:hypothetical protein